MVNLSHTRSRYGTIRRASALYSQSDSNLTGSTMRRKEFEAQLQVAGIAPQGVLGRRLPLPEQSWPIGRGVQLVQGEGGTWALRWKSRSELAASKEPSRHADDPRVLDAFVGLANATPQQVLAFARRYGMLHLCGH